MDVWMCVDGEVLTYMYVHIALAPGSWLLGLKRVDGEVR